MRILEVSGERVTAMTTQFEVGVFSREDAHAQLDKLAHRRFGMDAVEFIKRYDAGEYQDEDSRRVAEMEMLLPFTR